MRIASEELVFQGGQQSRQDSPIDIVKEVDDEKEDERGSSTGFSHVRHIAIAELDTAIVNVKRMLGDSASERAFYSFGCGLASLVYRVKAIGLGNLPSGGF